MEEDKKPPKIVVPKAPKDKAPKEGQGFLRKNRIWIIIGLLFVISNSGIYFYQRFQQQKQLEKYHDELLYKAGLADDLAELKNKDMGWTLNQVLVYGIRGELMRGNQEQLANFLHSLVRETGVELVAIVDSSGSVSISTDKKYEGKRLRDLYPGLENGVTQPMVLFSDQDQTVAAAPILYNARQMGVYFMIYRADNATVNLLEQIREDRLGEGKKEEEKADKGPQKPE